MGWGGRGNNVRLRRVSSYGCYTLDANWTHSLPYALQTSASMRSITVRDRLSESFALGLKAVQHTA